MPIYQVTRVGSQFGVTSDGVVISTHNTRGEAIAAAVKLKEGN